jgi:hypothetical protein
VAIRCDHHQDAEVADVFERIRTADLSRELREFGLAVLSIWPGFWRDGAGT